MVVKKSPISSSPSGEGQVQLPSQAALQQATKLLGQNHHSSLNGSWKSVRLCRQQTTTAFWLFQTHLDQLSGNMNIYIWICMSGLIEAVFKDHFWHLTSAFRITSLGAAHWLNWNCSFGCWGANCHPQVFKDGPQTWQNSFPNFPEWLHPVQALKNWADTFGFNKLQSIYNISTIKKWGMEWKVSFEPFFSICFSVEPFLSSDAPQDSCWAQHGVHMTRLGTSGLELNFLARHVKIELSD